MSVLRIIESRQSEVMTCGADTSVKDAVGLLADRRIGALPVMDGNRVVGMFSERDVIYRLRDMGAEVLDKPVSDIMTSPAVTVEPETSVLAALSLMTRRRMRHLPVVEDGRMVGLVSIGDLVKYRIDKIEAEAEAMRTYIQMA